MPKTPELENKLRNSWIVVLRGQESEGHSFGVYHTKWTRDKCAHCRLLKGLDWRSHIFGPGTHAPFPESIFHGFASKEEVQAYLVGAGFWILTLQGCAKAKEEYDAGNAWGNSSARDLPRPSTRQYKRVTRRFDWMFHCLRAGSMFGIST